MNKIYKEIEAELDRAKKLHPDFPESIVRMVAIMAEEAGEAIREANRIEDDDNGDVEALRTELVQTAAMCVRCLEQLEAQTTKETEAWKHLCVSAEDCIGYPDEAAKRRSIEEMLNAMDIYAITIADESTLKKPFPKKFTITLSGELKVQQ